MWAIRVLSGTQAGQFFPLKTGANVLGRAPSCDIKILSPNVSKEHVKIDIYEGKIIVTDMNSRNGTFVNGTQFRSTKVRPGDRIGMHDVIFEIVPLSMIQQYQTAAAVGQIPVPQSIPHPHLHAVPPSNFEAPQAHSPPARTQSEGVKFAVEQYLERVVLPGIYRLAELMELKTLLGLFMAGFILLVTSLSTIPLIRILRDSVEDQSQQHAVTIAATLARVNEAAVREGLYTSINMATAQRSGVKDAVIINKEGNVIAPASRVESYTDLPFVHEARLGEREVVKQVDADTVVAVSPIVAYNPETGTRGTIAFAVVKYDMSSLAVNDSKTISLFVITLAIASALGIILFFFLYKLFEYPVNSINRQLDTALREGRDDVRTTFQFEPLQNLTSKINSALSRAMAGAGPQQVARPLEHDRRVEMSNLVEMIGFPAVVVSAHDRTIAAMNQGFEARTRLDPARFVNQPIQSINDQALKLNILDLLDRVEQNPDQLAQNELEFNGQNNQLVAQAIFGTSKVAYYLVIAVPAGGEG